MEIEPIDDFERELEQAFARRPAPPSLKRRLAEQGLFQEQALPVQRPAWFHWQRMAASITLAAAVAGGVQWHILEQRRKEEAAREQVLLALRITNRTLNQLNARLAARHRAAQGSSEN